MSLLLRAVGDQNFPSAYLDDGGDDGETDQGGCRWLHSKYKSQQTLPIAQNSTFPSSGLSALPVHRVYSWLDDGACRAMQWAGSSQAMELQQGTTTPPASTLQRMHRSMVESAQNGSNEVPDCERTPNAATQAAHTARGRYKDAQVHYEIWKKYQSTGNERAEVLQNLSVRCRT